MGYFRNTMLHKISLWSATRKIYSVIVWLVLSMAIGYWFIIRSDIGDYKTMKGQEVSLRHEFELVQYNASSARLYHQQINRLEKHVTKMQHHFSTKSLAVPALLDEVTKQGLACGLFFESFTPLSAVQSDFYLEIPIKIAVLGKYHQLIEFMQRIVHIVPMVTLHDFVIERASQSRATNLLSMTITAKIYRSFSC